MCVKEELGTILRDVVGGKLYLRDENSGMLFELNVGEEVENEKGLNLEKVGEI